MERVECVCEPDTFMENSYNLTIIVILNDCKRKIALQGIFLGKVERNGALTAT